MRHVVLLGDSIFDNANWTAGGPDVVTHLRGMLPTGWKATLLAFDGATTGQLDKQLERIPPDATHLFLSIGGNDALGYISVLTQTVRTTAEAMVVFSEIMAEFEARYAEAIRKVKARDLPTVVCTVYNPWFDDPNWRKAMTTTVTLFNDCMIRTVCRHNLPLLDLRFITTEEADFTANIEPSSQGGRKIARAVADVLERCDFSRRRTEIFTN